MNIVGLRCILSCIALSALGSHLLRHTAFRRLAAPLTATLLSIAVLPLHAPHAAAQTISVPTADGPREATIVPARGPAPLVIVLHGGTNNAAQVRRQMSWDRIAARENIALAYPEGVGRLWNDGRPAAARRLRSVPQPDDVAFLRALIRQLAAAGIADPRRVFVTGPSNGGHMTFRMVCLASDVVAGGAAIIANLHAALARECRGRPVPVMFISGTADRIAAWEGEQLGGPDTRMLSAADTLTFFARRNGCSGPPAVRDIPPRDPRAPTRASVYTAQNCRVPAAAIRIEGGGHQIPRSLPSFGPTMESVLGPRNRDVDAAEAIWSFFKSAAR